MGLVNSLGHSRALWNNKRSVSTLLKGGKRVLVYCRLRGVHISVALCIVTDADCILMLGRGSRTTGRSHDPIVARVTRFNLRNFFVESAPKFLDC